MKVIDRPVFDHLEFTTEQFFEVLIGFAVSQYVLVFFRKYLPPVVGIVPWFDVVSSICGMKILPLPLLTV